MKMKIVLSVCIAICFGQQYVRGGDVHKRYKRGTCDPKYSDLDAGHTMCLDDHPKATVLRFTDEEKQKIVDQHNTFRAKADAAGMMKMIWDDNIQPIAQKWSQQCYMGHESESILRATPTLNGIQLGQNVAAYVGGTYLQATDMWHEEIEDFEYGKGQKANATGAIGHYTQGGRSKEGTGK